jgi:hypothetical protein
MLLFRRDLETAVRMPVATSGGVACPEQEVNCIMSVKLQYHTASRGSIAAVAFISIMR